MQGVVARHFRSRGFPDVRVEARRESELVIIDSEKGESREFDSTVVVGLPEKEAGELAEVLGGASAVAEMARNPERLDRLVSTILSSWGFRGSRVKTCEIEQVTDKRSRVVLHVDAGTPKLISSLAKEGDDPLGAIDFEKLGLGEDERLDRRIVEVAVSSVRDTYREAGYFDAEVDATIEQHDEETGWKVVLNLDSGPLMKGASVHVAGLRHLRESTLRRGIDMEVGSLFRSSDLDSSVVNVATFAPVERVDVKIDPEGPDGSRIEMVVTEKPRWTFDVGAGYGSERGVHGSFGIGDENLFGRGISLNLRGRIDSSENLYLLYGAVPARPGSRWALTSTIRYFEGDSPFDPEYLSEEERSISFGATIGLEPGDASMASTVLRPYYRFSRTHTFEKEPDPFFPLDITTDVAALGIQFVRDRYDNPFDPSRGYFISTDVGWSEEWLGSDLNTASLTGSVGLALEPWKGTTWWQVLKLGHATALDDGELDPEVRFFAGGQASIRGFERDSVGPTTWGFGGELVPAGGGALFVLNEEFRVPVWGPVRLAAFADIGQVWESWSSVDTRFAVGMGVGVRISTPIGPLWADVAWPVSNRGISEDGAKFYFGIGRPF
jgi:outer membrane protein insertion porin family